MLFNDKANIHIFNVSSVSKRGCLDLNFNKSRVLLIINVNQTIELISRKISKKIQK